MDDKLDFEISEDTLKKILLLKQQMGLENKTWDEWFNCLIETNTSNLKKQSSIERVFEENHYKKNYENWVKFFALNLPNIWNESSARELDPSSEPNYDPKKNSAIVIGAGPSLKKFNHLEKLADSDYNGSIICTDRSLELVLKKGITPDKFPKFYVATIDPAEILKKFYTDEIIHKFGPKINGFFSTVIHPDVIGKARESRIKIHWLHSLFDYNEGKKSFNQISALMVRAKNHTNGLPAIQTGGNVGTSCWFIAWKILKCATVGLIGMNHGWDKDGDWDEILSHSNAPLDMDRNSPEFKKLFPTIYNPDFDCYCIQDPTYQYYSNAFKDFIKMSPEWLTTVNATEGGVLFGERIHSMQFDEFVDKYKQ